MNTTRPLVHPQMLGRLRSFYPETCTIQAKREPAVLDNAGQDVTPYDDLAGHLNIPCYRATSPLRRMEVKQEDKTIAFDARMVQLRGHYPAITPQMRVVFSDATYDIQDVNHDSQAQTTRLMGYEVKL